jgi:bis(5'-nucleosyl)-tetraphosphatase (symmetrical)|tara:strand:+ start:8245 stop:9054 length:810 start_codon:yes stop_codon:yes gene_type:complete
MRTYVFGDIQGCFDELERLLDMVNYDASADRLWFVGDLINRGPKNLESLDFIMSQKQVTVVLGNHDLHFLALASGHRAPHPSDTVTDLLASPRLPEIVDWIRSQPLIHADQESGTVMVHAGIPPMWNLDTCLARAREVETALQSEDYTAFLKGMYGNEPEEWRDNLAGQDRLRIITNYFTRMRYVTLNGKLELTHKGSEVPAGFSPWFDLMRPTQAFQRILFGHWAALEGLTNNESAIALDTGCVWGRNLTAFCIEDNQFFSTPANPVR